MYPIFICRWVSYILSITISILLISFIKTPYRKYRQTEMKFFKYMFYFILFWSIASIIDPLIFSYTFIKFDSFEQAYPYIQRQTIFSFSFLAIGTAYHIKFFKSLMNIHIHSKFILFLEFFLFSIGVLLFIFVSFYLFYLLIISLQILYLFGSTLFFLYEFYKSLQVRSQVIKILRIKENEYYGNNSEELKRKNKLKGEVNINSNNKNYNNSKNNNNVRTTQKLFNGTINGLLSLAHAGLFNIFVNVSFVFHEIIKISNYNLINECSLFLPLGWGVSIIAFLLIRWGYAFPLLQIQNFLKKDNFNHNKNQNKNTLLLAGAIYFQIGNNSLAALIGEKLIELFPEEFPTLARVFENYEKLSRKIEKKENLNVNNKNKYENVNDDKRHIIKNKKYLDENKGENGENISIFIYTLSGLQLFKWDCSPEFDSELLGGFLSAIQAFSSEFQNDQLEAIVFKHRRFILYREPKQMFYTVAVTDLEKPEEETNKLLKIISKRFKQKYQKNLNELQGVTAFFSDFNEDMKEILQN